jgi:uncharacterized protein
MLNAHQPEPPRRAQNLPAQPVTSPRAWTSAGRIVARLVRVPARTAAALVWLYQKTISPALVVLNPTCGCRFAPTCSQYARDALRERGLIAGLSLTLVRLVKCGPWHPGGEDPVPLRRTPVCTKVSPV